MKAQALSCMMFLFLLAGQSACPARSSSNQKKITYNIHLNQTLDSYESYIGSLNPNNLFSVEAAAKKFKEHFNQSPDNISDKAFAAFWGFYLTAADSAGQRLCYNDKYKYLAGIKDYNLNPDKYKNLKFELTLNKKILNDNDFRLLSLLNSYGLMFDSKDGHLIINFGSTNFLLNNFGKNLSTAMRDYVTETIKEANESLIENDKIILPVEKIAERTIWWENFINENKNFFLLSECRLTYNFYLSTLLYGIDNPTASGFKSFSNEKEFLEAYQLITEKYSGTKTASVMSQYYDQLSKNNRAAAG